ncbi:MULTISPECIES: MalY/PatB family protein [Corynebacterium]|uniref:MalY/PatB family protein n=1 Tax=Corynebacterium TaxID=1716 RepID=UPI00124D657D|nr:MULTISPECIES: aminotransferase class I/II-fold pyridoxal phosphate-dependent enzyme [Corynebacterium]
MVCHFLDNDTLRRRGTRKWNTYDPALLPLWIAESDFSTHPDVITALRQAVEREAFGYPVQVEGVKEGMSAFYRQRYGWAPEPDQVEVTADVVRSVQLAIELLSSPEDAIIVPVPAYMPFLELPRITGREMLCIDADPQPSLEQIRQAHARGGRVLILCSPHNPLGVIYEREYLVQLTDLAAELGMLVIVDEIHAPICYERPYVPVASVSENARRVCVTATATSKAWNIAGLKCAQMYFTNPDHQAAFQAAGPLVTDGYSTLGLVGAAAAYTASTDYLDEQLELLRRNRDYLLHALPEALPGIKASAPEATYLMWLDFGDTALAAGEETAAEYLEHHCRVVLNDGATFAPAGRYAHCARLNFATPPENLETFVELLRRAQ